MFCISLDIHTEVELLGYKAVPFKYFFLFSWGTLIIGVERFINLQNNNIVCKTNLMMCNIVVWAYKGRTPIFCNLVIQSKVFGISRVVWNDLWKMKSRWLDNERRNIFLVRGHCTNKITETINNVMMCVGSHYPHTKLGSEHIYCF